MPNIKNWEELLRNCNISTIVYNGSSCTKIIGPNNNYIILPFAGGGNYGDDRGYHGYYWSSTAHYKDCAYYVFFYNDGYEIGTPERERGLSIRPIKEIDY